MFRPDALQAVRNDAPCAMRLGFDLVQISQVADSIKQFGPAYEGRLFTTGELDYANSGPGVRAERLAARFAAKEAVVKALRLSEAGVSLRDIEVRKLEDGRCDVKLHGRAAELAAGMGAGRILLSLSHDGDYAGAVVTVPVQQDAVESAEALA